MGVACWAELRLGWEVGQSVTQSQTLRRLWAAWTADTAPLAENNKNKYRSRDSSWS